MEVLYRIRDADLEVRPDLGCLRRATEEEIYLRPKTFQTLLLLLDNRQRVVTKDDIAAHIWPGIAVTDDAVVQCIVEIRKALGDDARAGRFVRTLPKSGYRFVGDVEVEPLPSAVDATPVAAAVLPAALPAPRARRWSFATLLVGVVGVLSLTAAAVLLPRPDDPSQRVVDSLAAARGQRQTIAVMFLENQSQTPELDWLREGLADMLVTGLARSQALSVVGRQQLQVLLDRAGYPRGATIDLTRAIDVATRGHLDHFVMGTFSTLGTTIRIDLRLHDGGGRLIKAEALTIDQPDDLLRQVDALGWRLAQHFGELASDAPVAGSVMTANVEAYRYYSLGVSKATAFHSLEAIELLTRATELDPEFAMAFARLGYVYGVTWSHVERARPYLAKAYSMSSRLSEKDRLQVEAWNALVQFDYPSAIASFGRLIRAYPTEVEAYSRLGLLLAGERRYDESLDVFQRGLAVDPESGDLWNRLGGVYDEMARPGDAIAARQNYVALQPSEANAHDSLGLSYQNGGRYEEAVASYRRALALVPTFEIPWVHLGNAYVQMGRYTDAEEAYRHYIKGAASEQEASRGWGSLALVAYKKGQVQEALARLRMQKVRRILEGPIRLAVGEPIDRLAEEFRTPPVTANRGSPTGDRAWLYLQAQLALKRGETSKAIERLQAALRERPLLADADSLEDCLANAYLQLGRFDEAIAEYERLLRINPRFPLAHYRLGLAYDGKRRPDLAQKSYEDFLRVWAGADRDVPEVVAAQARLASLRSPSPRS